MKIIVLSLPMILIIASTFAQSKIEARLIDNQTGEAIPFASISSLDGKSGTVSYIDGSFSLSVATFPSIVIVSHVNYGKTEVTFSNSQSARDIRLEPLTTQLPEINVSANDATVIVGHAYTRIAHESSKMIGQGFYRQWTRNDDIYSELIESFHQSRIAPEGIQQSKVMQGRYAVRKSSSEKLLINNNFSVFTTTFPLIATTDRSFLVPLREDAEQFFEFKLSHFIKTKDQRRVFVISFTPRKSNPKPGFEGTLYIDDHYNLVRFKGSIQDPRFNPIGSELDGLTSQAKLDIDLYCQTQIDDIPLLESLKADLYYKYRYSESKTREIHTSSFYFVYDHDTTNVDRDLGKVNQDNDYQALMSGQYDETFWEKRQVLTHTPVEKDLIKQFGKSKEFRKVFKQ